MKNIFEKLNEKNICYAISVTLIEFKSIGTGFTCRDYAIIIANTDLTKDQTEKLEFINNSENDYEVLERELTYNEVSLFRAMKNDFLRVQHNEHGRIYELKNNSFKKYYDSIAIDQARAALKLLEDEK